MKQAKLKPLAASILSLSLLTVMAGAAVAPALEVIRAHFSDASRTSVQLIVSMPAVFIVMTNLCFNRLAEKFGSKTLVMTGLVLYTAGGCCAPCCGRCCRCVQRSGPSAASASSAARSCWHAPDI